MTNNNKVRYFWERVSNFNQPEARKYHFLASNWLKFVTLPRKYRTLYSLRQKNTGWPKSNVPKVRAYSSASDHLIRKIFSGVCRDIHWFEEYLKIIEFDDHFFE